MYVYTALNQDGTKTVLDKTAKKWDYDRVKKFIGNLIEYLPSDYFADGMQGSVIGDEEG